MSISAEILTIGDEILYGHIVDTNTQWIGNKLTEIGIRPARKISVGDIAGDILESLGGSLQRADIVIITGGLGPTKDDITKQTLCKFFGTQLIVNQEALAEVTSFFEKRGRPLTEINKKQAELPANAVYVPNYWGTAPGMWFEKNGKIVVSLPGVPFEMKNLMEVHVLPKLVEYFHPPVIIHKTIRTIGIGESFLAERIEAWENALPAHIKLAYLPSFGGVKLRLTGTGADRELLTQQITDEVEKVTPVINPYVYGYDDDEIEEVIGRMLLHSQATLSTAESCTGGFVAHKLTSVPGSSRYFQGSVVSYSNDVKESVLNVNSSTLDSYGAVSEQTAREMAEGARMALNTTFAISTTGIAGPDGGSETKPVGTVWIACASPARTETQLLKLGSLRQVNIELTAMHVLNLLRKEILFNTQANIE